MTRAARVQALQAEAQRLALVAANDFARRLAALGKEAKALSTMGEAVPVGVRQLAARIGNQAAFDAANIRNLSK